tara:strand:- start:370 stop:918 length:549 start_codon:yes stop_codon:yes gene_type:complete
MALALSGTSNGSLNNLSLSGNTATVVDTGKAGTIVQVVQATTQTTVSVTTTTYTDTTLSASITPTSSSNKILVLVTQHVFHGRTVVAMGSGVRLVRGSTVIWTPPNDSQGPFLDFISSSTNHYWLFSLNYLDSPATTSSVTYKTQGRPYRTTDSGSFTAQPAPSGTGEPNTPAVMTLLEVVA